MGVTFVGKRRNWWSPKRFISYFSPRPQSTFALSPAFLKVAGGPALFSCSTSIVRPQTRWQASLCSVVGPVGFCHVLKAIITGENDSECQSQGKLKALED